MFLGIQPRAKSLGSSYTGLLPQTLRSSYTGLYPQNVEWLQGQTEPFSATAGLRILCRIGALSWAGVRGRRFGERDLCQNWNPLMRNWNPSISNWSGIRVPRMKNLSCIGVRGRRGGERGRPPRVLRNRSDFQFLQRVPIPHKTVHIHTVDYEEFEIGRTPTLQFLNRVLIPHKRVQKGSNIASEGSNTGLRPVPRLIKKKERTPTFLVFFFLFMAGRRTRASTSRASKSVSLLLLLLDYP